MSCNAIRQYVTLSEQFLHLDNSKDTLEKETVSDDLIVSNNDIKATLRNVLVQDKVNAVNANFQGDNKQVLTAHLVKSLFSSLGAPIVSSIYPTPVASLSSTNASPRATTTPA